MPTFKNVVEQSHHLVSYTCGHFAVVPVEDGRWTTTSQSILELVDEKRALDDLLEHATTIHVRIPNRSCQSECQSHSLEEIKKRVEWGIFDLRCYLKMAGKDHRELGQRYHNLHFNMRAGYAKIESCALAHQQFAIESRAWREDPEFAPWFKVLKLLEQAESLCHVEWTQDAVTDALRCLNDARSTIGRVVASMKDLRGGVARMESRLKAAQTSPRAKERRDHKEHIKQLKLQKLKELAASDKLKAECRAQKHPPYKTPSPEEIKASRRFKNRKSVVKIGGMHMRMWVLKKSIAERLGKRMEGFDKFLQEHRDKSEHMVS